MNFSDILSIASENKQAAAKLTSEKRFSTDLPKVKKDKPEKQKKEIKSEFLRRIEEEKRRKQEERERKEKEESKRKRQEEIAKNTFRIPKKVKSSDSESDISKSDLKLEKERVDSAETENKSKHSSDSKHKSKNAASSENDSSSTSHDAKRKSDTKKSHSSTPNSDPNSGDKAESSKDKKSSSKSDRRSEDKIESSKHSKHSSKSDHNGNNKSESSRHWESSKSVRRSEDKIESSKHSKHSSSSSKDKHKKSSKHKSHKSSKNEKSERSDSNSKESKNTSENEDAKSNSDTSLLPMSVRNNLHDTSSDRTAHMFSAGLKHIERKSLSEMTEQERVRKALQEKLRRVRENITHANCVKANRSTTKRSTSEKKVNDSPNKLSVKSKEFISDKDDEEILSKPAPKFEKVDQDPSKKLAFESNSADLIINPDELLVRSTDLASKRQQKKEELKRKKEEIRQAQKRLKKRQEERSDKHSYKEKLFHKHKEKHKEKRDKSSKGDRHPKPVKKHIVKHNNKHHAKPLDFKALLQLASQKQADPPPPPPQVKKTPTKKEKEVEEHPMTQEEKERLARKKTKEYKDWYEKGISPKSKREASANSSRLSDIQSDSVKNGNVPKKPQINSKNDGFKIPAVTPKQSHNPGVAFKHSQHSQSAAKAGSRVNKDIPRKNGEANPRTSKYEEHENVLVCKPSQQTSSAKKPDSFSNPWDRLYGEIKKNKPPPSDMKRKRQVIESDSDSEYDSEMDDFIDDDPLDDADIVSSSIRDIFGYDKRKYRHIDEDDDRSMEASFKDIMKEEAVSTRIGKQEDLEDMRMEEEEIRRKKMLKMKKSKMK